MLCTIFGNFIPAFVTKLVSELVMFIIMSVVVLTAVFLIIMLRKPIKIIDEKSEVLKESVVSIERSQRKVESLKGADINKESENLESGQLSSNLENGPTSEQEAVNPPKATIKSTLKLFLTPKMLIVSLYIIVGSMILAVYSELLVMLIRNTVPDKNEKLSKSLHCMIILGFGEMFGSLSMGKIIDVFGHRSGVIITTAVVLSTIGITIYSHSRNKYDIVWFIVSFMWGVSDSKINTVCISICGTEFDTKIEPFAILNFAYALATSPFLIAEGQMTGSDQTDIQRWYFVGCAVFTLIAGTLCASIKFKAKAR